MECAGVIWVEVVYKMIPKMLTTCKLALDDIERLGSINIRQGVP